MNIDFKQIAEKYPNHKFLFLSKGLEKYVEWVFPKNCWLGVTVTNQIDFDYSFSYMKSGYENNNVFLSIEPIQTKIRTPKNYYHDDLQWIIVGAETGNQKNKIIPKKEWIEDIRIFCQDNDIPYFEKPSLQKIVNRKLVQEFPND